MPIRPRMESAPAGAWLDSRGERERPPVHPMLSTAVKSARRAATVIQRASNNLDILKPEQKRPNDFVSEVDRAAENTIIDTLRSAYPDHAILAEESGASGMGQSDYEWIIDPLDGTTNYLHGYPYYCVSIALAVKGVLTLGVVYDPAHNDLFTAERGGGAFLNERRIRVGKRTQLTDCLVSTGHPHVNTDQLDTDMAMLKAMIQTTVGVRRQGSAALDLAYVACGRTDGYWEMNLNPWDIAAGALLVQEAGGIVTDLDGNEGWLDSGNVVAANPKVMHQMLQTLAKA